MTAESVTRFGDPGDNGSKGAAGGDNAGGTGDDGTDGGNAGQGEGYTTVLTGLDADITEYELFELGGLGGDGGGGGGGGTGAAGGQGGDGGRGEASGAVTISGRGLNLDDLSILAASDYGGFGGGGGAGGDGTVLGGDGGDGGRGGDGGAVSVDLFSSTLQWSDIEVYGGTGGTGGGNPTIPDGVGGAGPAAGSGGHGGAGGVGGDGGLAILKFDGGTLGSGDHTLAVIGGNSGGGGIGGASDDGGFNGANGDSGRGGNAWLQLTNTYMAFGGLTGDFDPPLTVSLAAVGGYGAGGLTSQFMADNFIGGTPDSSADGHGGDGGDAILQFQSNHITGTADDESLAIDLSLVAGQAVDTLDPSYNVIGDHGSNGTATLIFSGNQIDGGGGVDTLYLSGLTYADEDGVDGASPHKSQEVFDIIIDMRHDVLVVGGQANSLKNVENIDLSEYALYPSDSLTMHDYVSTVTITGTSADNVFVSSQGVDLLRGMGGNDILDGWLGADRMVGGAGDDTYYVDDIHDQAIELNPADGSDAGGHDVIRASLTYALKANIEDLELLGSDNIKGLGNGLDNTLTGNVGDNVLRGQGGADELDGGAGADILFGGAGNDIYHVDDSGDVVSEQTVHEIDDGGLDTVFASVSFSLGRYIENLTLTGSDAINGIGNSESNTIYGNDASNILVGNLGSDILDGGAGSDFMYGGAGNDIYYVDDAGDHVSESPNGTDDSGWDMVVSTVTFRLGDYFEVLYLDGQDDINGWGNALANSLTGNDGANVLGGGDGADTLDGGEGADIMYGGAGNDTYYVDNAGDILSEHISGPADDGGADTVFATVSFRLDTYVEYLVLDGSDNIDGTGNNQANTLYGNAGDNVLTGKAGNDVLTGGDGADTFVFSHFGGANGIDSIEDFTSGTDQLSFTAADFGWTAGHVLDGSELSYDTAAGAGGQFIFDTGSTSLWWDTNGSLAGGLTQLCIFDNGATPTTADFVFT